MSRICQGTRFGKTNTQFSISAQNLSMGSSSIHKCKSLDVTVPGLSIYDAEGWPLTPNQRPVLCLAKRFESETQKPAEFPMTECYPESQRCFLLTFWTSFEYLDVNFHEPHLKSKLILTYDSAHLYPILGFKILKSMSLLTLKINIAWKILLVAILKYLCRVSFQKFDL